MKMVIIFLPNFNLRNRIGKKYRYKNNEIILNTIFFSIKYKFYIFKNGT